MASINWQAVSAIAEAVAALGVIFSLVYVGVQVRQATLETRVGVLRAVVNELGRVHDSLAQHEDLADLTVRGMADYASLTVTERARLSSHLAHMFKLFEQLFVLHRSGAMDLSDWRGYERAIADIAAYPGVWAWCESRSQWMREDFRSYLWTLTERPSRPNIYLEQATTADTSR